MKRGCKRYREIYKIFTYEDIWHTFGKLVRLNKDQYWVRPHGGFYVSIPKSERKINNMIFRFLFREMKSLASTIRHKSLISRCHEQSKKTRA